MKIVEDLRQARGSSSVDPLTERSPPLNPSRQVDDNLSIFDPHRIGFDWNGTRR